MLFKEVLIGVDGSQLRLVNRFKDHALKTGRRILNVEHVVHVYEILKMAGIETPVPPEAVNNVHKAGIRHPDALTRIKRDFIAIN